MNRLQLSEFLLAGFFGTDEGGQGGGTADHGSPNEEGDGKDNPPALETVTKEEHDKAVDRYRNQYGQEKKAREDLEKRLAAIEVANQTEAERLAVQAKRAEELEPQVTALTERAEAVEAALAEEVDAQAKLLSKPDQKRYAALPECGAADRLKWIRTAREIAAEEARSGGLPPGGGRNPAHQKPNNELTEEQRQAHLRQTASRF